MRCRKDADSFIDSSETYESVGEGNLSTDTLAHAELSTVALHKPIPKT